MRLEKAASGFFLLVHPLGRATVSGEKIASSSVSLTECSAGFERRSHNQESTLARTHIRTYVRTLAHESSYVPTKVAHLIFEVKSPLRQPATTTLSDSLFLSCEYATSGLLFASSGPRQCPFHSSSRGRTPSSIPPPGSPVHHAVVCRPCVLPHTTYVGRHATSAHARSAVSAAATATATAAADSASSRARDFFFHEHARDRKCHRG